MLPHPVPGTTNGTPSHSPLLWTMTLTQIVLHRSRCQLVHPTPPGAQPAPHTWTEPTYGAKQQLTPPASQPTPQHPFHPMAWNEFYKSPLPSFTRSEPLIQPCTSPYAPLRLNNAKPPKQLPRKSYISLTSAPLHIQMQLFATEQVTWSSNNTVTHHTSLKLKPAPVNMLNFSTLGTSSSIGKNNGALSATSTIIQNVSSTVEAGCGSLFDTIQRRRPNPHHPWTNGPSATCHPKNQDRQLNNPRLCQQLPQIKTIQIPGHALLLDPRSYETRPIQHLLVAPQPHQ